MRTLMPSRGLEPGHAKSRTLTRVGRFHHKEPNQLMYDQFTYPCLSCLLYVVRAFGWCEIKLGRSLEPRSHGLGVFGKIDV